MLSKELSMDKLWILTEEKPKVSVIQEIIKLYCRDFNDRVVFSEDQRITPVFNNSKFEFYYLFEGARLEGCSEIVLMTVSGASSFFDFLVFKQENKPDGSVNDNLLMAVEETKTNGDESRNTGVYQRGTKFVFIENYYTNIKKYMLYNEELENDESKKPADTIIFGTNIFLTLGAEIVGKETGRWFSKFNTLDDLIGFKAAMRKAPGSNVAINIVKYDDRIEISGRLSKPANKGNILHDPNIGALSMISKAIRKLGWDKDIIITNHGVKQEYINNTEGKNKFLYICKMLNLKLDNIILPQIILPDKYWYYENSSEKVASILFHIMAENSHLRAVYQNHAGCERGYFKTESEELIAIPKRNQNGVKINIPDLILHSSEQNEIFLIEGKKLSTINAGLLQLETFDQVEREYVERYYPNCRIHKGLCIYGGNSSTVPHGKVIFYLTQDGRVCCNSNIPSYLKEMILGQAEIV